MTGNNSNGSSKEWDPDRSVGGADCSTDLVPMDPHTFSEGIWVLQTYINSLQPPSQKVCGSIGCVVLGSNFLFS